MRRPSRIRKAIGALVFIAAIGLVGFCARQYGNAHRQQGSNGISTEPVQPGFEIGLLPPGESIEQIRVTIETAAGGEIDEPLDLHLGFGFPLRLGVGAIEQLGPVFAALPTASSLEIGTDVIPAGSSVWFQFGPTGQTSDRDPLMTSRTLLQDLDVSDINQIGFAAKGSSEWTLAGYRIEINDQLYAANGSFDKSPYRANAEHQVKAAQMMAHHDVLVREVQDLQAVDQAGFASEAEQQVLKQKQIELSELVPSLQRLSGQLRGHYPVISETDSAYLHVPAPSDTPSTIRVRLTTGGDPRPGTANPVYLNAGGRKYLLASEVAPLADDRQPQTFEISTADLNFDPVSRADVEQFAIGMLGSNEPFDEIPDRARLQRVTVEVDGQPMFDSDASLTDRRSLEQIALIPPAHRDDSGAVVVNTDNDFQRYTWQPGMQLPAPDSADGKPTQPIEPPTRRVSYSPPAGSRQDDGAFDTPVPSPDGTLPVASAGNVGQPAVQSGFGNGASLPLPPYAPPIRSTDSTGQNQIGASDVLLAVLLNDLLDRLRGPGANANPGSNNSATPVLIPADQKLQIKNVRFGSVDRAFSLPTDGIASTVEWEVANDQQVAEFQVKLWARLPHRSNQLPILLTTSPKIKNLAASQISLISAGNATPSPDVRAVRMPEIDLAASLLPVGEHVRAFVEPEVLAFDSDGKVIPLGAAAKGPLMPLRTAESTQIVFNIGRDRSIQLANQAAFDDGQFQIDGDGYDPPESTMAWQPFVAQPTNDGKSVWAATEPTNSHNAISFEVSDLAHVVGISSWDDNVGQITVRFDNRLKFDTNYRLVGHLGFINGSPTTDNEVEVHARLIVQDLAVDSNGDEQPHAIAKIQSTVVPQDREVFRAETSAATTYVKQGATTPLMLIDIPIARDLDYDSYNQALEIDPHQTGLFTLSGLTIDPTYEQNKLPLDFVDHAMVSLTLMVKMKNQVDDEAIGLFGLRLVKDPVQPAISPTGPMSTPTDKISAQDRDEILKLHNDERALVGVDPLQWSDQLTKDAQIFAEAGAARTTPTDQQLIARLSGYGKSYAVGPNITAIETVKGWLAEKSDYENGLNDQNGNKEVAHYTQLVWGDTKHLGAGIATLPDRKTEIVVVFYDPAGNVDGEEPYSNAPHMFGQSGGGTGSTDSDVTLLVGTWLRQVDESNQRGWASWIFATDGTFTEQTHYQYGPAGNPTYHSNGSLAGTYSKSGNKLSLDFKSVDDHPHIIEGSSEYTTVTLTGDNLRLGFPQREWGEFKRHDPSQPLPPIP